MTAIATTILGTSRALSLFFDDAFATQKRAATAEQSVATAEQTNVPADGRRWSALAYAACIGVPALIACRAAAADAFFGAIDLAGASPVAILWGLVPPLMALRLRGSRSPSSTAVLAALIAVSAAFVGSNAVADVAALLGSGSARWR